MPNCSVCLAYVMWVELGHYNFLYMPAVSHIVTTGNNKGTNHALGFEFSIQSSVFGDTTVAKVNLFSTRTRSTVSFLLYVSIQIYPFTHRKFNTQTKLLYLGFVNVTIFSGTRCS